MSTIAFIGLGIMGGPMAEHLVKAGHTVIGFNRSPGPVERLVAAGGRGASSVAEAVREADVIITWSRTRPMWRAWR
jgi:2-hydroxy-3-oxopropionate reductase